MKKTAILFGNDNYDFGGVQLQCAVNDARALEEKLAVLDFETKSVLNSDYRTMATEISEYENVLSGYDVGLFFFAGHGFQLGGLNYLAATDTSFTDDRSAAYTSFRLDDVIEAMNRSNVLIKILIIDACRSSSVWWKQRGRKRICSDICTKGNDYWFCNISGANGERERRTWTFYSGYS